jgi:hypothetical protein
MVPENVQERRVFQRFPARFPAKFKDSRDDFGTRVALRNASAEGAHIISRDRLYLHDRVSLEVELPDGHAPMVLKGEVVWAHPEPADCWDAGIRFHAVDLVHMSRMYRIVAPEMSPAS